MLVIGNVGVFGLSVCCVEVVVEVGYLDIEEYKVGFMCFDGMDGFVVIGVGFDDFDIFMCL
ncbi:hypothetical protein DF186_14495, partial [Enterococcus hirae]